MLIMITLLIPSRSPGTLEKYGAHEILYGIDVDLL